MQLNAPTKRPKPLPMPTAELRRAPRPRRLTLFQSPPLLQILPPIHDIVELQRPFAPAKPLQQSLERIRWAQSFDARVPQIPRVPQPHEQLGQGIPPLESQPARL